MKTIAYRGQRGAGKSRVYDVTVVRIMEDGTQQSLRPRLDIAHHSPSGFEWGYNGSGPCQLAVAILVDVYGDDIATYMELVNDFKYHVISKLHREPNSVWTIPVKEVLRFVACGRAGFGPILRYFNKYRLKITEVAPLRRTPRKNEVVISIDKTTTYRDVLKQFGDEAGVQLDHITDSDLSGEYKELEWETPHGKVISTDTSIKQEWAGSDEALLVITLEVR